MPVTGTRAAETVDTVPGDATLGVDALEVTNQQRAEVDTRRNRRLATQLVLDVVRCAALLESTIKAELITQQVQSPKERTACRTRQLIDRDERRFLPLLLLTHRENPFHTRHHVHATAGIYQPRQELFQRPVRPRVDGPLRGG